MKSYEVYNGRSGRKIQRLELIFWRFYRISGDFDLYPLCPFKMIKIFKDIYFRVN